jgi:putative membrane protein
MLRRRILPIAAAAAAAAAMIVSSGTGAAPPPSGVSGLDQQYLKMAASGDVFEVEGGRLALQKSHDKRVRALAQMLMTDHTKSLHDTVALATKLGVKGVQKQPTQSQAWELKALAAMPSEAQFNHWYAVLEVRDHKQDISDARDERDNGTNPEVRDNARTELPTLFKHLKASEKAAR